MTHFQVDKITRATTTRPGPRARDSIQQCTAEGECIERYGTSAVRLLFCRNPRGSPFCPCFSRNLSEDEMSVNGMPLAAEQTAVSAEASREAAALSVSSSTSERHLRVPSNQQGTPVDAADAVTGAEASARPPMPRRLTNTWDSVLRAASQFGSLLVSALSTGESFPAAPDRGFTRSAAGSVSESAHGQLISIDGM